MFKTSSAITFAFTVGFAANGVLAQSTTIQQTVDTNFEALQAAVVEAGLPEISSIDHARLAIAEGVQMPASRVFIFSDPKINTAILEQNIRSGLDLPFRFLSFDQDGVAQVQHTTSKFISIRHGLGETRALEAFKSKQLEAFDGLEVAAAPTDALSLNYGVIELKSNLSVPSAVKNLTETVQAQDDTVWFGKIDFSDEALQLGIDLPKAVLLLFGGPKPGGVAMANFPAIGLDAFCQKLLIYEGEDGGSVVIYNDIAALAELHYGKSIKPHHALNERLTATFQKALK